MTKPITIGGYAADVTEACERVLVTLMRGLGPYAESVFLVGGLAPRYLVKDRPPEIPAHAGTADVDVVIDIGILADTKAYHTLEENLKRMGFERGSNAAGVKVSWRWQATLETGQPMILEFLTDAPSSAGGKVQEVPGEGSISAMGIPHAAMVFNHYREIEITADLLDGDGRVTEIIRYADVVSFICLKAFAFDNRAERKDAHDLIYCMTYFEGGAEGVADAFRVALEGHHAETIRSALDIIRKRFCDDANSEGYRKDGPVKAARFETDDGAEDEQARDRRILRQRQISDIVAGFYQALEPPAAVEA